MPTIRKGLAAIAVGLALAASAHADIRAFNAAVRAGDYATAASEAETIWKTWDKADEQTALIAREFGFAALVSGRNELARDFGKFLFEEGAKLPTPDAQPMTSAVLYRLADFRTEGGEPRRSALREALQARNAAPGLDMTSVLAWEVLYVGDWSAADWSAAQTDAAAAAEFLQRETSLIHRQRAAEVVAASADFLENRSRITQGRNDMYHRMADLHDAIVRDINAAASQPVREALWASKWKAEAWTYALESYLQSSYEQIGSNISTKLQPRRLAQPMLAPHPETGPNASLPVCQGEFKGRKLTYPASREYQGVVGSVIARMETDAAGKVTSVETLAAVPHEGFADRVVETLRTWSYKPDRGVDVSTCRLNSRNQIYRVLFFIG